MSEGQSLQARLGRLQIPALIAGGIGLAVTLLAALIWPRVALPAYLVAFLFWVGLALGCVSLTMLHHLTGGGWGMPIRRPMEAGGMALLPMLVLFLPLAIGAGALYPWADAGYVRDHPAVAHKAQYLNTGWFIGRTLAYFALWIVLAYLLRRWSLEQDRTESFAPSDRLRQFSGPGLAAVFLTATFASIDWGMSLEPNWYSTIYGAMVIVGWGLETFAAMIVVAALLSRFEPMATVANPTRLHDLGNLLLAFVMLWAYLSFSQYLIIWSGNLAEEIPWYLRRSRGGWQYVAAALMVFHFAVPFFILLFRENKRSVRPLLYIASAIVVMHVVDLCWLVLPFNSEPLRPSVPWGAVLLVPAAMAGVGGVWVWFFLGQLKSRPMVPRHVAGVDVLAEHDTGTGIST